jgi:hypothetical protein
LHLVASFGFCFPDQGGDLTGQYRHARDRRRDGVFCDEETHAFGAGHLLFVLFIHNAEHFGRGGGPNRDDPPTIFRNFPPEGRSVELKEP